MLDLMTTREVAELLRVPESTVRFWRHARTGPAAVKFGRSVRYAREDVLKFVDQAREASLPVAS
jgi:excisionase family DNA binding protein